ncbi:inactive transglutaminase family protein [Shewanella sp. D64]|uniref:inactive transglutaminase family protein n=1 Tax=unclassified Shewanella TaxID=196818 RepID=UPI0022BA3FA9|nr:MULTISPECIES: inactive transglutaminase family protein [unclassified Shewanella]MEC4725278.1 inactive transglutaminase family protein [Shewanella sp. D64]MEC4735876.1 inactive transglutaminase family protein [Shewanella sp. E94]WBJ93155.1 inactive transglutaminase family protein [Shewanella sp. MTB7]
MHSKKPFYILVALLFIAGIATSVFRGVEHKVPFLPGKQVQSWAVDAKVSFQGTGGPAEVSFSLPNDPAFEVLVENASSPGYGLTISQDKQGRRALWSVRSAKGLQNLYYKVTLIPTGTTEVIASGVPATPQIYIWPATEKEAAEQIIDKVWAKSATNITFAQQLNKALNASDRSQNVELLLSNNTPIQLFLHMLHNKGVPAKEVSGLFLEDQRRRQQLTSFVEVYNDGKWVLFNPADGTQGRSDDVLLWDRSGTSTLDVTGGVNSQVNFSMLQDTRSALATSLDLMRNQGALDFSLYQLPLEEQSLFKGILLIPVGVLMVVFLRVIVGLKTSGTFMPVLIALAFIQTTLLTGLIGFILIVACGLMIRSYLSQLNLLLISRISAVIIVVIGIIGVFTLLSYKFGLSEGLTITFFPMIILAWTIERMSILWEEEGPKEVVIQGGGSLFVATLAYLAMSASWAQHWVFNFLGIHLVILALVLLMGQYTGYRLFELRRFKPLAGE